MRKRKPPPLSMNKAALIKDQLAHHSRMLGLWARFYDGEDQTLVDAIIDLREEFLTRLGKGLK
jgi:hypothetical protein